MTAHAGWHGSSPATIEILFLSGPLRGKRYCSASSVLSVGDAEACDVCLLPEDRTSGVNREAIIQRSASGWAVRNVGTSIVIVNHTIVDGDARLKSGDVIRMSPAGPEFVFTVVTQASPKQPTEFVDKTVTSNSPLDQSKEPRKHVSWGWVVAAAAVTLTLFLFTLIWLRLPPEEVFGVRSIPVQSLVEETPWALDVGEYVVSADRRDCSFRARTQLPDGLSLDEPTGMMSWTPTEAQAPASYHVDIEVSYGKLAIVCHVSLAVGERNVPPQLLHVPDVEFALGSREALEVQVLAVDYDLPRQPLTFGLGSGAPGAMTIGRNTGLIRWTPQLDDGGRVFSIEVLVSDPATAQTPQRLKFLVTVLRPEVTAPSEQDLSAAIFLLCMEEPKSATMFPFAVAFAVRENILATSGLVVQELAAARAKGMLVYAMQCLSAKTEQIDALYLHPEFVRLQDAPSEQVYCDLGLVRISHDVRSVAPLAGAGGPIVLEQGMPLRCVLPVFDAEPLTHFDDITPASHKAKVDMVTTRPSAAAPREKQSRLLHVVGALPKNAFGSPFVNQEGQVVAIYVEKAELSDSGSLAALAGRYHYATVLDSLDELLDDNLNFWQLVPRP